MVNARDVAKQAADRVRLPRVDTRGVCVCGLMCTLDRRPSIEQVTEYSNNEDGVVRELKKLHAEGRLQPPRGVMK